MRKPHRLGLPAGFRLGHYVVQDQLGSGGFGITYRAHDRQRNRRVALKELLPSAIVTRIQGFQVAPHSESEVGMWKWAQESFAVEADTLAACRHPNVLQVYEVFRANGTVYMISRYEEGGTLAEWLEECGTMPQPELMSILRPLLSALETVHARGFLHRDIKPDNIYLAVDGRPVLIDFGSARQIITSKSRPLTTILTPGYAPFEQYSSAGDQGPWTDIYALGAVMYRAITSKVPPDAGQRLTAKFDPCVRLLTAYRGQYDDALLNSVDQALIMAERQRTQSVAAWLARLEKIRGNAVAPHPEPLPEPIEPTEKAPEVPPPQAPPQVPQQTGCDLHQTVPVPIPVALRGGVHVAGVGRSRIPLRLAPGTAEGTLFRFRGLGLPKGNTSERGDLYLKVTLVAGPAPHPASRGSLVGALVSLVAPGLGSLRGAAALPCLLSFALIGILYFKCLANRFDDETRVLVALGAALLHLGAVVIAGLGTSVPGRRFWPASRGEQGMSLLLGLSLAATYFLGQAPGDRRVEDDIAFRWCPPGEFQMGSAEPSAPPEEKPQHLETITQGFWIAETELTRAQWERVLPPVSGSSHPGDARLPVTDVTWAQCVQWCELETGRLKITPWRIALPTERQWEYACRSGTTTPFATASGQLTPAVANYNSGGRPLALSEVGQPNHANAWHIYDMHGNVWEWCRDLYQAYPGSTAVPMPMMLSYHICRGGSYLQSAEDCRSAHRYHGDSATRMQSLGFRPVLTRD